MPRELYIPVVKIHQKWGSDNNLTTIAYLNYPHILKSQSTFQKPKFSKRVFPHDTSWRYDHNVAS